MNKTLDRSICTNTDSACAGPDGSRLSGSDCGNDGDDDDVHPRIFTTRSRVAELLQARGVLGETLKWELAAGTESEENQRWDDPDARTQDSREKERER